MPQHDKDTPISDAKQLGIVFVSTMGSERWGGSEELWARTALKLANQGISVSASLKHWPTPHTAVVNLRDHGVEVAFRRSDHPLWHRAWRKLTRRGVSQSRDDLDEFITARNPDLIVFSNGAAWPPLEYLELCLERNWRFVTIAHNNFVHWWPNDTEAERYRKGLARAERCYFVSDANRRLAELQLGCEFTNAEIVRNPFNVPIDTSPSWPSEGGTLRLACVGRLYPPAKGQDILLQVLADPRWRSRDWFLSLYGTGAMRGSLARLIDRLELNDRVAFAGHVDEVQDIWASNHLLVMPSRFEGMPLVIVEAMLCGRPVVATDVGGLSEVIRDGVTGFLANAPTVHVFGVALEQAWHKRRELREMGKVAASHIRQLVPADPIRVFTQQLTAIARRSGRSVKEPGFDGKLVSSSVDAH